MGYAPPGTSPLELIELAQEAERLGYRPAWAAEAWGTDAVSVLSWLGASTSTINLGTAILQLPARTPSNVGMTAVTLDLLSGGRVLLGLGTSGPQVVEGWHGEPWGKPLRKTREYVEIVRAVIRREVVEFDGAALPGALPRRRRDRARQAAEADGPPAARRDPDLPRVAAAEERSRLPPRSPTAGYRFSSRPSGRAPRSRSRSRAKGFDIAPRRARSRRHDLETARDALRPYYALYVGGMGARGANFYNDLARTYGFEAEAEKIQDLYLGRPQRDAAAAVPDAAHRRDGARRAARAHPRPARRVARVGRDRAADLDARPGDAAHGGGGGRVTVATSST